MKKTTGKSRNPHWICYYCECYNSMIRNFCLSCNNSKKELDDQQKIDVIVYNTTGRKSLRARTNRYD